MSSLTNKLALAATIAVGTFSFAPATMAGEGGIAASAAFEIDSGDSEALLSPDRVVDDVAVGSAVGAASAYAGAATDAGEKEGARAFAAGTDGTLQTQSDDPLFVDNIAPPDTGNLTSPQGNEIDDQAININARTGVGSLEASPDSNSGQ